VGTMLFSGHPWDDFWELPLTPGNGVPQIM
jgi:hypothetical protein